MDEFCPFRLDKAYDEQTVSSIRFPNGSLAQVAHSPNTWASALGNAIARGALQAWTKR